MAKLTKPCVYAVAFEIICPKCETTILSPKEESTYWTSNDPDLYQEEFIQCHYYCGAKLVVLKYTSGKFISR